MVLKKNKEEKNTAAYSNIDIRFTMFNIKFKIRAHLYSIPFIHHVVLKFYYEIFLCNCNAQKMSIVMWLKNSSTCFIFFKNPLEDSMGPHNTKMVFFRNGFFKKVSHL